LPPVPPRSCDVPVTGTLRQNRHPVKNPLLRFEPFSLSPLVLPWGSDFSGTPLHLGRTSAILPSHHARNRRIRHAHNPLLLRQGLRGQRLPTPRHRRERTRDPRRQQPGWRKVHQRLLPRLQPAVRAERAGPSLHRWSAPGRAVQAVSGRPPGTRRCGSPPRSWPNPGPGSVQAR